MTPDTVIDIAQQAMTVMVMLAAPLLVAALVIGLVIGMFQAATQINEMTLSFIPKLLGLIFVLFAMGPWLLHLLVDYTRRLITDIPHLIG